jgi:hypothetical protein
MRASSAFSGIRHHCAGSPAGARTRAEPRRNWYLIPGYRRRYQAMPGAPPPAAKMAGAGSDVNVQPFSPRDSLPKRTDGTRWPGVTTDHSISSVAPVLLAHTVAG